MQIHIIFAVTGAHSDEDQQVFLYGDFFKFLGPTGPDRNSSKTSLLASHIDMFTSQHHIRMSPSRMPMSDIVVLTDVLEVVQLVPNLGQWLRGSGIGNNSLALGTKSFLTPSQTRIHFTLSLLISSWKILYYHCICEHWYFTNAILFDNWEISPI